MAFTFLFSFYDYYSGSFKNCCAVGFRSARQFVDAFENARFTDENISYIHFHGIGSGSANQGNTPFTNSLLAELKNFTENNCNMSALFDGHAMQPVVFCMSVGNEDWSLIAGKRFKIDFWDNCIVVNQGPFKIATFDFVFGDTVPNLYNQPVRPVTNNSVLYCYPHVDWDTRRTKMLEALAINPNAFFGLSCFRAPDSPVDCSDLRTSEDGQNIHFVISDGESNVTELDVPFLLSEGSNQEKAIKTYMNDTLYNSLINLYNLNHNVMARCYFNAGIVRSSCTVRLVGKVYGQSVGIKPSTTPPFVQFDYDVVGGTDVDILKAEFEPCSDKPVRITEDLRAFLQGLNVHGDLSLGFNLYQVLPYKVVIENCTALNDFCCDDNTPSDEDSITIEPTDGLIQIYGGTQGGSSGGDDVNIQCICDNLNSINNTLLAFKDSNQASLQAISNTLSELDINVDNTCVCENLQTVSDSIIAVKDSIDNKELSVVNNNTVQPPVNNVTVQPPVNNVTVQPPVNNVTVPSTDLENIANNTRSLNNIFDELYNMNVVQSNMEGYIGNIRDSLECDKKGIACVLAEKTMRVDVDVDNAQVSNGLQDISDKLSTLNDNVHDSLFNSDDESNLENINKSLNTSDDVSKNIADVINDKDMGTNIDVEVSPADDVNINRVYYTNQKNGDNNL